jgi:hypothetical protein
MVQTRENDFSTRDLEVKMFRSNCEFILEMRQ